MAKIKRRRKELKHNKESEEGYHFKELCDKIFQNVYFILLPIRQNFTNRSPRSVHVHIYVNVGFEMTAMKMLAVTPDKGESREHIIPFSIGLVLKK